MGRVQDAVLEALANEIGCRAEWDQPPGLHTIYYTADRKAHLGTLPVPLEIWAAMPPAEILSDIAGIYESNSAATRSVAPAELFAVAFFCEMWMASQPVDPGRDWDEQQREFVSKANAAGGVSRLPDRVEARHIWAVDRAGTTYAAWQLRGEEEITTDVTYRRAGTPDGDRPRGPVARPDRDGDDRRHHPGQAAFLTRLRG
jgi:hypothetical protein